MAMALRSSSRLGLDVFFDVFAVMLEIVPTVLAITAAADATLPEDPSSVTGVSGGPGMLPALALR